MSDIQITPALVGQRVCVPSRPEWGAGTVLHVQSTTANGHPLHRVSIQFPTGHRTLVVPPAVLAEPQAEPERAAGWLDTLGKRTLDDRLASLPESATQCLGGPAERITTLAVLYAYTDDPGSLEQWARRQAQVADPLSQWSRDELAVAFRAFCTERDSVLRVAAALLRQKDGPEAVEELLGGFEPAVTARMWQALARVI